MITTTRTPTKKRPWSCSSTNDTATKETRPPRPRIRRQCASLRYEQSPFMWTTTVKFGTILLLQQGFSFSPVVRVSSFPLSSSSRSKVTLLDDGMHRARQSNSRLVLSALTPPESKDGPTYSENNRKNNDFRKSSMMEKFWDNKMAGLVSDITTALACSVLTAVLMFQHSESAWATSASEQTELVGRTSITRTTSSTTTVQVDEADFPPQYAEQERLAQRASNEALIDYAVGTINTQYYDNSGGAWFNPTDFYNQWRTLRRISSTQAATTTSSVHDHQQRQSGFSLVVTSSSSSNANNKDYSSSSSNPRHSTTKQNQESLQHVLHKEQIPADVLSLDTREGTVRALKYLVGTLQDPYSKYMTREELNQERFGHNDGFLGTGAFVDVPTDRRVGAAITDKYSSVRTPPMIGKNSNKNNIMATLQSSPTTISSITRPKSLLTATRIENLPVVKAVAPNSPAERAGIVVGDRIVAVGDRDFLGWTREEVGKILTTRYSPTDNTYVGAADLTIAKPVLVYDDSDFVNVNGIDQRKQNVPSVVSAEVGRSSSLPREVVLGYRSFRVRIPSKAAVENESGQTASVRQGNTAVQYELLSSTTGSIFDHLHSTDVDPDNYKVGYIRLTRFSKASTAGYVQAVQALEDDGAESYIIDLRNNYGGVIQEAMMTASTLLRDPHAILCWTLNARGGFVPHDVEEYAVDPRYPGYLLSTDPRTSTLDQLQKEQPQLFVKPGEFATGGKGSRGGLVDVRNALADGTLAANWDPPSSFASIHEHVVKRGIRRISSLNDLDTMTSSTHKRLQNYFSKEQLEQERLNRKQIIVLINEGTASSAEFFTAALKDNGRTVAVVGTKTYGKGLIQHTFPMPDGGGLKITIGEYLRPSLRHVTQVGGARFDAAGELTGGVKPDVYCDSRQGIPSHPTADLCVGVALDILEETRSSTPNLSSPTSSSSQLMGKQVGR